MKKVKNIEQTCVMFPSQWEGEFEDGEYIYIRERHGVLTVEISDSRDEWLNNKQEEILCESVGTGGMMNKEHVIEFTKNIIDFSDCEFINEKT